MDQMNISTYLTKTHAEYEDMIKAAFGLHIERTSVPTADHRLASASIALEMKDRGNWYTNNRQLHGVGGPSSWMSCSFRTVAHITCEVNLLLRLP